MTDLMNIANAPALSPVGLAQAFSADMSSALAPKEAAAKNKYYNSMSAHNDAVTAGINAQNDSIAKQAEEKAMLLDAYKNHTKVFDDSTPGANSQLQTPQPAQPGLTQPAVPTPAPVAQLPNISPQQVNRQDRLATLGQAPASQLAPGAIQSASAMTLADTAPAPQRTPAEQAAINSPAISTAALIGSHSNENLHPETSVSVDPENPTHAGYQVFKDANGTTMSLDRTGLLKELMDKGRPDLALDLAKTFTATDRAAEIQKRADTVSQTTDLLTKVSALNMLPASLQPARYQALLAEATKAGEDVSMLPAQYNPAILGKIENQLRTQTERDKKSYDDALIADSQAKEKDTVALETAKNTESARHDKAVEGIESYKANTAAKNASGALPAVANVPPHLIAPATSAYQKSGEKLAEAQNASDDMETIIQAARQGNKLAGAYAPVEGVLALNTARGVKRVNMSEIESYAGAGNVSDKIKSWLGKAKDGQPIPADVLDDMEKLHSAVGDNAQKLHNNSVKVINQTYGANFQPMSFGSNATTPGTAPVSIPKGYDINQALADAKVAVSQGADKTAVMARAKAHGFDLTGRM